MIKFLRIGTRGSPLALWQANWVRNRLIAQYSDIDVKLIHIQTSGDKILNTALSMMNSRGIFTREIERALLDNEVDVAVHSMKDLPTVLPEGLAIAAIPEREDPRDALIAKHANSIQDLPQNGQVVTSSLRRKSQLLHLRPDLRILDIRGNVGTRLDKFDASDWDAIVLARAGLVRLGFEARISQNLRPAEFLSAVGQGALAVQTRADDKDTIECLSFLNDPSTNTAVTAERAFLHRLEGGCQVPVAARAILQDNILNLDGLIASPNGTAYYRGQESGNLDDAEKIGITLAERLLSDGGKSVLEEIRIG